MQATLVKNDKQKLVGYSFMLYVEWNFVTAAFFPQSVFISYNSCNIFPLYFVLFMFWTFFVIGLISFFGASNLWSKIILIVFLVVKYFSLRVENHFWSFRTVFDLKKAKNVLDSSSYIVSFGFTRICCSFCIVYFDSVNF